MKVALRLPDGSTREYPGTVTPGQLASDIGKRLGEAAIAAKVDGVITDLNRPIIKDATVEIITKDSKDGLEVLRHSTAHLLAQAVKELYPTAQITIGPVIEDGFYYDIDCPVTLNQDELTKIEAKMTEIAARKLDVKRKEIPRDEAVQFFKKQGENYKMELIKSFPDGEVVSVYEQGNFTDLCRGPHVPNTSKLGKFKLLNVAGAYWRGSEANKMLQRIYGTAFPTQKELDEHLHMLEEAKKRDHRKLGPELALFTFLPVAPAMPFYLPKGATVVNQLFDFMRRETVIQGYTEVICPQIMTSQLWKTSGHWDNYRDNMFWFGEEEEGMSIKPMNCPGHCALFASTLHSYRDLPVRFSEFTKLHRNERAGVTHGLFRTRAFCQDDGHLFCTEEQLGQEALTFIQHTFNIYKMFDFTHVEVKLATRPEKFLGKAEVYDRATDTLAQSLRDAGVQFKFANGEGAFYGPKIEFHIRDSLKRYWQCGTIQLDYNMPERFKLEYIDKDGQPKRPVMLHRAVLGSIERFLGILIEHFNGHLPFWIAPTHVTVINVTDDHAAYAKEVTEQIRKWGYRAETDLNNEKLGYKIRQAQLARVPLMVVIGNQEVSSKTVSVRLTNGETKNAQSMETFHTFLNDLYRRSSTGELGQVNLGGNTH